MFQEIPRTRPTTPLLDQLDSTEQLRDLNGDQLPQLATELREFLLFSVGQTGGHFGAGLGVVELTIALHYCFDTPHDRIIWDVGHQAYPHKILTGRRDQMPTLRQKGGISAFPKRTESIFDTFGVGHSSTSISAALGLAIAARAQGEERRCVAVIGDGAMTAGMAFEALNHAGDEHANMLIVLNDNDMAISDNVGGLSNYLARLLSSRTYQNVRQGSKKVLANLPKALELVRRTEEHVKGMVAPGTLFEELGFNYIGPVDGHDLPTLVTTLNNMRHMEGPQFLHVVTKKGKGFAPAEADPVGYHAINKLEPTDSPQRSTQPKFANIFGQWLCDMADADPKLMGITPAMKEGSDLIEFAQKHPSRYFDVAIAEQHAVTLAAGMACEGLKPVVAIYSTFLQRGYDQLIHDVAVQNLDVLFAIDRAGLVGEDGPTHAGCYDIAFLRCIPNILLMTPANESETRQLLTTGYQHCGPAAVRYPRGCGIGQQPDGHLSPLPVGQAAIQRQGQNVAILAFGPLLYEAQSAADNLNATLVNMRFVKPLDTKLIAQLAREHSLIVTLEEGCIQGGAGSAVNEFLLAEDLQVRVLNLGIPDRLIEQAKPEQQRNDCGLDAASIQQSIEKKLAKRTLTLTTLS